MNKINSAKTIAHATESFLGKLLTGDIGGAIASGVNGSLDIQQTALQNQINIASNKNDIAMLATKLGDAQNSPSQLVGNGNDMSGVITKSNLTPIIYHQELWDKLKLKCGYYFQCFGVSLGSLPRNPNDFIDSRYHFNFLQMQSSFENYLETMPLTNEVRQILDKSLANGLTIWHVRNPDTFKGIKNWNVNNVETKWATFKITKTTTFDTQTFSTALFGAKIITND